MSTITATYDDRSAQAIATMEAGAEAAVQRAAGVVQTGTDRLVPLRSGFLESTATVSWVRRGAKTVAAVSYKTPYAKKLYFQADQIHFRNGRTGKWLELGLEDQREMALGILQQVLREVLR